MLELNHKKLTSWKLAIELYAEILMLVKVLPKDEQFNLSSQIRRAALSISNNIAEGAARKSNNERKRFYEIARSSCVEVDNCIEVILSVKYFNKSQTAKAEDLITQIFKLLTTMINYTK